jgi:hypothetical protein
MCADFAELSSNPVYHTVFQTLIPYCPDIRRREDVRGRQDLPSWAPTVSRGVVGGRHHAGRPVSQIRNNCTSSGAFNITAYCTEISVFFTSLDSHGGRTS